MRDSVTENDNTMLCSCTYSRAIFPGISNKRCVPGTAMWTTAGRERQGSASEKNEINVKGVPHMFFFSSSSIFLVSRFVNVIENSRESGGTAMALRHVIALCSQRSFFLFFIVTCTYIRARNAREAMTRNEVNRNGIATRCDKFGDHLAAASVSTARPICGAYTEASFHTSPKWKRSRRSHMNEHPERDVMSAQLLYICVSSWIIKQ